MEEARYIISDASKLINVEQHTLRYWEEELELEIPRNELGHRYYREQDINLLKKIKELKDQGFQLKAIKLCIPDMDKLEKLDSVGLLKLRDAINDKEANKDGERTVEKESTVVSKAQTQELKERTHAERMGEFRSIMSEIISDVLKENNMELSDMVSMNVTNSVIKEMDYLIRMKEEREEERYRQLDRTIREVQNGKSKVAASKEKKAGKRGLFRNNNKSFA